MILALYTMLSLPFFMAIVGTVLFSIAFYLKSFINPRHTIPKLYFKESALASHLLKRCRLMNRKFDPPFWLRNRHVQSIIPYIVPCGSIEFDREYLQMKDRGVVALDWVVHVSIHKRKRCTILVVLPGMTANALSVSKICSLAAHKGYRPVVFNQRGHGGSVLTTPKIVSQGDPNDLRQVVKYIHGRYPKALINMVGYGTGCSVLLSYLGEFGSSANISAGVCVSACFDHSERFSKHIYSFYDILFLLKMKFIISSHAKALSKQINISELLKTWSFDKFNELVYFKLYGCSNMEEYWDRTNPLRDVDEISVPLMFINSLDDPFYSKLKIPHELCRYYPHFLMVVSKRGGHCGFAESPFDISWADKLAIDYLDAVLEFTNKGRTINYGKNPNRSTI